MIGRVDAEVGPEALQDRGIGTGPGEDRLFVVSHGEAAAVSRGEVRDDLVLRQAQVLELVHQHVVPAAPDVVARRRVLAQQLGRCGR